MTLVFGLFYLIIVVFVWAWMFPQGAPDLKTWSIAAIITFIPVAIVMAIESRKS